MDKDNKLLTTDIPEDWHKSIDQAKAIISSLFLQLEMPVSCGLAAMSELIMFALANKLANDKMTKEELRKVTTSFLISYFMPTASNFADAHIAQIKLMRSLTPSETNTMHKEALAKSDVIVRVVIPEPESTTKH